jgi:hypothetical protein
MMLFVIQAGDGGFHRAVRQVLLRRKSRLHLCLCFNGSGVFVCLRVYCVNPAQCAVVDKLVLPCKSGASHSHIEGVWHAKPERTAAGRAVRDKDKRCACV